MTDTPRTDNRAVEAGKLDPAAVVVPVAVGHELETELKTMTARLAGVVTTLRDWERIKMLIPGRDGMGDEVPADAQYVINTLKQLEDETATAERRARDAEGKVKVLMEMGRALRHHLGYIEAGEGSTLKLFQDEATKDFIALRGSTQLAFSPSWGGLLDELVKIFKEETKE